MYHSKVKAVIGTPKLLNRNVMKLSFDFIIGDDDFFPSIPHGQTRDRKYKLKLWTGQIYDMKNNGKIYKTANTNEMSKLYLSNRLHKFIKDAQAAYLERNPKYVKRNPNAFELEGEREIVEFLTANVKDTTKRRIKSYRNSVKTPLVNGYKFIRRYHLKNHSSSFEVLTYSITIEG